MIRCHELTVATKAGTTLLYPLSFQLPDGANLFLVGESGSGKSSFLEAVVGLSNHSVAGWIGTPPELAEELRTGESERRTSPAPEKCGKRNRRDRRGFQLPGSMLAVQEPASAFSPYRKLGAQWRDVTALSGETSARSTAILEHLGLEPAILELYPHQCSGGMLRRVNIAAVLAAWPTVALFDEPTGGIDPSRRWAVMATIRKYSSLFVLATHDMGLVGRESDDYIMVLKEGNAVEFGLARKVLSAPDHPYTRRLLEAGGRG
jgi:ABC-type glutathione transport system ATPase component